MAIIKCSNGHFFDSTKYDECPHCKKGTAPIDISENKTIAKIKPRENSENVTKSLRDIVKDGGDGGQKTVPIFLGEKNFNPIAGWLVCTEGENRGRSFEIHIGKNFVGRSMRMDIHINDPQVSRENHFSVIFDPKSIDFFVLRGNGITYYNGELLSDAEQLSEGDEIEAGGSKYIFIPYCREGREWREDEKKDENK